MANKIETGKNYETIIYEKDDDGIATITFNRPNRRNAINPQLEAETQDAVWDVREDDRMRVLILTGAGTSFCSGYDVREQFLAEEPASERYRKQRREMMRTGKRRFTFPFGLDFFKPSIAAVNGPSCGDGFSYALSSDIRICTPNAKFSYLYVRRGLIEGEAGIFMLPALIGYSRAAEMMLSGEWVEAEEALRIGLVREIVPPDKLMTRAREYAYKLLQGAPMPQWCIKQLLIRSMNNPTNLQELMNLWSSDLWRSEDFKEGATSFVEKREPKFKGW